MHVIINTGSMIPVYEQIVNQIRQKILMDELKEGDGLPSIMYPIRWTR